MKSLRYVIFSALVAALGGFLFGFDTAVISGAEKSVQEVFNLDGFWHGFTVAIALIGTVFGALFAGKPADILGRKKCLIIIGVLYAISAVGSALAGSWIPFLFYRFIGGLGVGASSVIGPMYISEISPAHMRGRLVALFQFNVVFGIMMSFFSNYLLSSIGENAWRWMFGVEFFPALIFFVLVLGIPNSPRWLVRQNRIEDARKVLNAVGEFNVEEALKDIAHSVLAEGSGVVRLFTRKYRLPILFAFLLATFNQLTGINAVMYYAPRIFQMAGIEKNASFLQAVAIGLTNLIVTVIAMTLIDRFGRKPMMIVGSIGTGLSLAMVSYTFFTESFEGYNILVYLMLFQGFFALSQGTVIWVFLAEIFPNRVRGKGQALGSFVHWSWAAAISWIFPLVAENPSIGGRYSFLFFSVMMVFQFFFAWKIMPETKGKSLEQIERDLGIV
ncbi:MAG: sugar porter family MFS transporter [Acidobacteriota bacterium]